MAQSAARTQRFLKHMATETAVHTTNQEYGHQLLQASFGCSRIHLNQYMLEWTEVEISLSSIPIHSNTRGLRGIQVHLNKSSRDHGRRKEPPDWLDRVTHGSILAAPAQLCFFTATDTGPAREKKIDEVVMYSRACAAPVICR